MNRTVLIVGALVITPLLIFLAMGFQQDPRAIESPLVGRPAPDFALHDMDGEVHQLSELKGQPVVLNFWATWCQPCIAEHPVLVAGAKRYEGQATFLGVIYQDDVANIRKYLARRGGFGPALLDPDSKTAIAYGVYGVPETFFIDASGIIVEKVAAPLSPRALANLVDPLITGS